MCTPSITMALGCVGYRKQTYFLYQIYDPFKPSGLVLNQTQIFLVFEVIFFWQTHLPVVKKKDFTKNV